MPERLKVSLRGSRNSANVAGIYEIVPQIMAAGTGHPISVDLSDVSFVPPCSIAALSICLQQCRALGHLQEGSNLIPPAQENVARYLQVMDFYALAGVRQPPRPQAHWQEQGYMRAAHIPADPPPGRSNDVGSALLRTIEETCDIQGPARRVLFNSLTEVIDNSTGEAGDVYLCHPLPQSGATCARLHRGPRVTPSKPVHPTQIEAMVSTSDRSMPSH